MLQLHGNPRTATRFMEIKRKQRAAIIMVSVVMIFICYNANRGDNIFIVMQWLMNNGVL